MKLIQEQIIKEKMSDKPDKHRITKLQSIIDSGKLCFDDFSESGRFVPVEVYKSQTKKAKLHKECTDVVCYFGDFIIQGLKSGMFLLEHKGASGYEIKIEHKKLDVVEAVLWTLIANLKINN
jgi:hypothetical protein